MGSGLRSYEDRSHVHAGIRRFADLCPDPPVETSAVEKIRKTMIVIRIFIRDLSFLYTVKLILSAFQGCFPVKIQECFPVNGSQR